MRVRAILAAIAALGIAGPTLAEEPLNPLTQDRAAESRPQVALPQGGGVSILWDLTHGVYLFYEPAGKYSDLVTLLSGAGMSVMTTTAGVETLDLSAYDIIVLAAGSTWDSAYGPAEVAALQDFVTNRGGSLLILGDNGNTPVSNLNPVTAAFGVTTGLDLIDPLDLYVDTFAAHPAFTGISTVYMRAAGTLGVSPPATAVAWTDAGAPVIAAADGSCTMVLGDSDPLTNPYIANADNAAFAVQLFHWLATCSEPVSVDGSTWGRIKASYR